MVTFAIGATQQLGLQTPYIHTETLSSAAFIVVLLGDEVVVRQNPDERRDRRYLHIMWVATVAHTIIHRTTISRPLDTSSRDVSDSPWAVKDKKRASRTLV
ncbi:hypothetical protein I7I51_02398 [Histoplasma capsulatum]|uniref:Uncharacterized protein n=1 Tax=Ajellomyces capsulatus TaxID=5037 RepID=A0A8A1M9P7_AJECA|nr:hypothetical protein I7I51_02398 [Histoplasma capsulatum]